MRVDEGDGTPTRFPRSIPALDGVRALAIVLVVLFHGGLSTVPGGFFGVDVFFVLSGFLITSLLLDERRHTGAVALRRFWAGRARRLLPALFLMVNAVVLWVAFVAPSGSHPTTRGDALSALLYAANWHFVAAGSNYFVANGLPSPLVHTWSLAIEEQFYAVWPLVVLGVLALARSVRWLGALCAAGALSSAAEMAALYRHGATTARIYYGTDTHAQGLLVGAVLACALYAWAGRRRSWAPLGAARRRGALAVAGAAALGGLLVVAGLDAGTDPFTSEGGCLVVSVLSAVMLWALVAAPVGPVHRVLALGPVRWLGRVSYGVYLWHVPIFVLVLTHASTGLGGWQLLSARVALTLTVASLSYYGLEMPIRTGAFWRRARALAAAAPALGGSLVALLLLAPSAAGALPAVAPAKLASAPTSERVLLVGDSTALTLGLDLTFATASSGVTLYNHGTIGCGVALGTEVQDNANLGPMVPACDATSPSADQWPAAWARWIKQTRPQVVAILAGRWEVVDFWWHDHWADILDPDFAAHVRADLQLAVTTASAGGAHVVLMTAPCYDSGEQPDGRPWPQDSPSRVGRYNQLVREVAAANPQVVTLFDLGGLVCPGGRFSLTVDGVTVRAPDGIHFPVSAVFSPDTPSPDTLATVKEFGAWIGRRLIPVLEASARLAR